MHNRRDTLDAAVGVIAFICHSSRDAIKLKSNLAGFIANRFHYI